MDSYDMDSFAKYSNTITVSLYVQLNSAACICTRLTVIVISFAISLVLPNHRIDIAFYFWRGMIVVMLL